MSKRFDIPSPNAPNFDDRMRETVMTYLGSQGDRMDRGLTVRDLVSAGVVKFAPGYTSANITSDNAPLAVGQEVQPVYITDLSPPPQPTGLVASGAISNILIGHDAPVFTQGHGYLRTNVYGAIYTGGALPTFADAVRITQFSGKVFAHATNPSTTFRLWAKWESNDGVESATPAGGTNGLAVTTGADVSSLVSAMTGTGNPFTILSASTVIGGVTFPAGTYSTQAFIRDAQITNAKIADATIDSAKIASLSASKIISGTIAVGQTISSTNYVAGSAGWSINGAGSAEFSGVTVRGAVYATSGTIGGSNMSSNAIASTNWNGIAGPTGAGWALSNDGNCYVNNIRARGEFNVGNFTGYAWPASGGGAHLSGSGLLIGNYNTGKYFQVYADGNVYAPAFNIINGSATFGGTLSAATGTFSGTLTADAVNAVNSINIAGYAVTVPFFAGFSGDTTFGNVSAQTGAQYLNAGASIIAICTYSSQRPGSFYGSSVALYVVSGAGGVWNIGGSGQSGQNYVSGAASGFFTVPYGGYYYVNASVSGESGGSVTGCSITALGGKK